MSISLAQGFESTDEEVVNDEGNSDDDATVGTTHGCKGGWGIGINNSHRLLIAAVVVGFWFGVWVLVVLTLPQWGTTYAVCPLISKEKVGIAVVDIVNQVYGLPLPWLFLVVRTWSCSFHHSASRRHHNTNGIEQHTVMERNR